MYNFVVYGGGKNERWSMVESSAELTKIPSFRSILSISHDPDAFLNQGIDPNEKVKYIGPMYFDLDGEEIADVIKSAQKLYLSLVDEKEIPEAAIKIFLSGKKGFHFTIDEKVFGITKPRLILPYIWREFAALFDNKHVDRSVYTGLKGRMWRCPNVQRPDNNRYKVQVTRKELMELSTEAEYVHLVSEPRPEFASTTDFSVVPSLASQVDACAESVKSMLRAQKKAAESISVDDLRNATGTPGCIELLVTEGDCPESNWNQAAMQLAGYVAAKYEMDEDDEYEPLVEQFLNTVESSSRPTYAERKKAYDYLHRKAFQGGIKFSAGGIITVIGKKCGDCVVCTRKQMVTGDDEDGNYYNPKYRMQLTEFAVNIMTENSTKEVGNFGITILEYNKVYDDRKQLIIQSRKCEVRHFIKGTSIHDVDDVSFYDHRKLQTDLGGSGVIWTGTDNELKMLMATLDERHKDADVKIRTRLAGINIVEQKDEDTGDIHFYPHLVCRDQSYAKGGTYSNYMYIGPKDVAPEFHKTPDFSSEEEMAASVETLKSLFYMNDVNTMTSAIGWVAATHLKAHITYDDKSFPMLNISGSSGTGKSSTAFILLTLNAFPYRKSTPWNAEVHTIFPLEDLVTSSTTVVRMLEEVNQHNVQKRNWEKLTGILKSSWDEGGILKGKLEGRNVVTSKMSNPAPIMFLSEQAFPVQSIRTRSIECHFSNIAIEDPECLRNHKFVIQNVKHLEMWAKMLANIALNTSFTRVEAMRKEADQLVPSPYSGRMRTAYSAVVVGLIYLRDAVGEFNLEFAEFMEQRINQYVSHLTLDTSVTLSDKKVSALDEIIMAMDTMAFESDNPQHGILANTHYWIEGETMYLDMWATFPRFRRYARGIGYETSVSSVGQLINLVKGETYYRGITASKHNPLADVVILDMEKMREKGLKLSNFEG